MFREKYELKARIDALRGDAGQRHRRARGGARDASPALEESRRVTHAAVYLVDADGARLRAARAPRAASRPSASTRRRAAPSSSGCSRTRRRSRSSSSSASTPRAAPARRPRPRRIDAIARALDEMNAGAVHPAHRRRPAARPAVPQGRAPARGLRHRRDRSVPRRSPRRWRSRCRTRKLYERMKERDRLAALGEMAAGLAHEIRNPLGAIKGAAQLLLPPADAATGDARRRRAEAREFLGIIVEEVNRLNRVVSQFLDYARPYRGEPQPLDVNEVVRKTAQLVTPPPVPRRRRGAAAGRGGALARRRAAARARRRRAAAPGVPEPGHQRGAGDADGRQAHHLDRRCARAAAAARRRSSSRCASATPAPASRRPS